MRTLAATVRRPTFEWFAVTLLCTVLTVLAAMEGWLWRIDQSIYDSVLTTWTRPPGPGNGTWRLVPFRGQRPRLHLKLRKHC